MKIILGNFRNKIKSFLPQLLIAMLLVEMAMVQMPLQSAQAQAGVPQLVLTKTTEGNVTTAEVGDTIRFRIRFECSSLTTDCGEMQITDVLPAGLTYLPPPNSSVPSGFTISESGGTVTIRKNDNNLLDGSQYDATIAVQVNYNLRPLPQDLTNTVGGWIDPPGTVGVQNATPSSAPPIRIDGVSADWSLTKVRISPSIEPTLNTDVTYQLMLCPNTTNGNVALSNIQFSDVLPANAVFVSASDGGVFNGLANTVTWNIAGPVTPPACATRYITLRYPSTDFSIGDAITNNGSATAEYITSGGGVCVTDCYSSGNIPLTHNIIPISEVPSYSKNDTGDPVGITGTARFTLNLNTNGTNWPGNEVVLIDNLYDPDPLQPNWKGQLQVISVTSGTWGASFNYVRAYVEYSTDVGVNWTAFPGQPVSYNTNATYTAPATNITNVRWRFEYDVDGDGTYTWGLPYTWSFTTSPQIRVTPRAIATPADPPSVAILQAAVVGSTYTNCLQVSRRDSSNNLVTGACDNETMTIRGDYVSLRPTKAETPGAAYDAQDDPNINTFTSDGSILPGDTMRYTLTVTMTERSSQPLVDPTILETLPSDLIFVRNGTARLDGTALATQPTFTQSGPNPGAGQTLRWDFPGLTIPTQTIGSHVLTVEFFARIPPGQTPGTRTNTLYVVTDSTDAFCEIGTQSEDSTRGDVDGDGDPTDIGCQNTDNYVVERSAALRGEKWIRAVTPQNNEVVDATTFLPDATCPNGGTLGITDIPTNPFTRYPCIAQAYPENAFINNQYTPPPPPIDPTLDDFEYNLRIFNDGNVPMIDYVLYDILPYSGDTGSGGTLSNSARNSEFRPAMRGPVQFLSGTGLTAANFTIEYNTTTNPCRPEVFNQPTGSVPTGCNNTWSTTDWATARSFRIRLNTGSSIAPAAANELRFGVPMYIPADAPLLGAVNSDDPFSHEIAWNSFSHVGSYDTGTEIRDLLASEPRKVGITIPEVMSIGNRVWRDSDNSGTINGPDDSAPGIAGVTVNLYRDANNDGIPDGPAIASTTTDSEGFYLFSNIPHNSVDATQNLYIVGIPASNFAVGQPLENLRSSTGTPAAATYTNPPEANPDQADHGRDPVTPGQEVFSATITLEPTTEEAGETDLSNNDRDGIPGARRGVNGERDNNSDLTVDFGFFGGTDVPFSIGNYLWYDNGPGANFDNGVRDTGEAPVPNARVEIYRDGNGNNTADPEEFVHFDVTDADGFYLFDNLDPGTYFVLVVPGNFTASFDPDGSGSLYSAAPGPLRGWVSSTSTGTENATQGGATDTASIDSDDNGINDPAPQTNGIISGPIVLTRGVPEPTGESHLSSDTGSNLGFDLTEDDGPQSRGRFGETDASSNLTVDFGFVALNTTADKQLTGTAITDTDPGTGLPISGTDFTSGTQVAIGEILTYEITLQVPAGLTFAELTAIDKLDAGLAFVDCDSISAPNLTTTLAGDFAAACNPDTNPTVDPQSTPESQTDANLVTFSLGDVTNSTAATQTITITYSVIVLDASTNRDGVSGLNNKVSWAWDGTTKLNAEATPVEVVEPDLSIDKRATPSSAPYGTNISFSLTIAHTSASSTDAFDVVAIDILPSGLQYVVGSVSFAGLNPNVPTPPADYYDPATSTLTFEWDTFPLGQTATITFLATFVGPSPVVNGASVAWTSLPIDPQPGGQPVTLSPYNDFSTERWYDPTDLTGLNAYDARDSLRIILPSQGGNNGGNGSGNNKIASVLPATGFAPNVVTELPSMPAGFAYAQTDLLLEIPKIKQKLNITGVPYDSKKSGWNLTWLSNEAGWLETTAFPTHSGNSALTAHTTLANGLPGPFARLGTLSYGDQVIVRLGGQKYIFEVRENKQVKPTEVNSTLKHEEYPWLTLITCKSYNEKTGEYTYRTVVRAVLVSVIDE